MKEFFFNFWNNNIRNEKQNRTKTSNPRARRLSMEPLESRDLLSVTPLPEIPDDSWWTHSADIAPIPQFFTAAATNISPVIEDNVLLIEGTNNDDWIEILETEIQVIVYSFSTNRVSELEQWAFTKSEIAMIAFSGYDGNDTFINSYENITSSIVCRLDGGTGNNTLIGGSGNDWIYGGTGDSILDGADGDNIIVGGFGNNTFVNTGIGSNCFITMDSNYDWADGSSNRSSGDDDALLIFSDKDRQGDSNYTYNNVTYEFARWTEDQVLDAVASIEHIYERIGSYQFFQYHRYKEDDFAIYFCYTTNTDITFAGLCPYTSGIHFAGAVTATKSTLIHEVAHLWNFNPGSGYNDNAFYEPFALISWESSDREAPHKNDAVVEDFAREYGMTDPWEDWTTTVTNVVTGIMPENASAKYLQKVEIVKSFLRTFFIGADLSVLPMITPPQPTATRTSDHVELTWDAIPEAQNYQVYRWNGTAWDNLGYARSSNYIDTTARADVDERYVIRANGWGGIGGYADSSSIRVPYAPVNFRSTGTTLNSVTLEWDERDSFPSGYALKLEYKAANESTWRIWTPAPSHSASEETVTGLLANMTYEFRLTGTVAGNSAYSLTTATTDAPPAPDLVTFDGGSIPNSIAKGETFSVTTDVIQNTGELASSPYTVTFYALTDNVQPVTSGISLGSVNMPTLASGGTTYAVHNVDSAASAQLEGGSSYYIGWSISGVDGEINLDNNTGRSTAQMSVTNQVETPSVIVTTLDDIVDDRDGLISLREAIAYAGTAGLGTTITFDASLQGGTITLNGTELGINKDLTIDATGDGITIDADEKSRIFHVFNGAEFTVAGMTLTGGNAGSGYGGAIYVNDSTAIVTDSIISGNTASDGGGIYIGSGEATIMNSVVSGNLAGEKGGGISNDRGVLTVVNSTIAGNDSLSEGGGIYLAGAVNNEYSRLTLYNSIVALNVASTQDDNIYQGTDAVVQGANYLVGIYPTDPMFVKIPAINTNTTGANYNPEDWDLRLNIGSAAINAGNNDYAKYVDGSSIEFDLNGKPRINVGTVDLGAYEFIYNAHDWQKVDSQNLYDYATWEEINGEWRLTRIEADSGDLTGTLDLSDCTELEYVDVNNNQLSELDISNNPELEVLDCRNNQLTFSTLPLPGPISSYTYAPQNEVAIKQLDGIVDLSSEFLIDGETTVFTWRYADGNEIPVNLYTNENGRFTFDSSLGNSTVYCEMTNVIFSELTLRTNSITIISVPTDYNAHDWQIAETAKANNGLTDEHVTWEIINGEYRLTEINAAGTDEQLGSLSGELNLSGCTELQFVNVSYNQLTQLDVLNNTALTDLNCGDNQLTQLDVSSNIALSVLWCYSNELTELNISNNTALTFLSCGDNQLTQLDVSNNAALTDLRCGYNQLTQLDVSNNTSLTSLRCYYNQLTQLDISNNTVLTELDCALNQLTSLDVSSNTVLTELWCESNKLTDIDVSNNTILTFLSCGENQLTQLDVSNNTALTELRCFYNQLAQLNVSNNTELTILDFCFNELTQLDVSNNTALTYLCCEFNQLTFSTLPLQGTISDYKYAPQNDMEIETSIKNDLPLDLSGEYLIDGTQTEYTWYYDDGTQVPKNFYTETDGVFIFREIQSGVIYCEMTNTIFSELTLKTTSIRIISVSVGYNVHDKQIVETAKAKNGLTDDHVTWEIINGEYRLTAVDAAGEDNEQLGLLSGELDLSGCSELLYVDVSYNELTKLNVSNNTALEYLNCHYNALAELDVSNNTALAVLDCDLNQLTELDVSNNTALLDLYCYNNQLTQLDVSNNPALTVLDCDLNQLTELDVSNNPALIELWCGGNQLTQLNVSNNPALEFLACYTNQLTHLDVSDKTALRSLYCYDNQLTQLNVSNNPALELLACYTNQLTHLDVSDKTDLRSLYCYNNQLTELDVSNNTALTVLECDTNQLTELDVSNNTALTKLWCGENQLTQLDVSNNPALTILVCDLNQLTQLDVSNNPALTELWCESNELTQLDVSNNTALTELWCNDNQLTQLDVSNNAALTELRCFYNQLAQLDVSNNTELTILDFCFNELTQLDVSNNTALTYLCCEFNQLTFSTLPLQGTISDYKYAPQNDMEIESSIKNNLPLDLSGEYLINGTRTVYTWYYAGGTQVPTHLYSETDGVFVFHGLQDNDVIYCEMKNTIFYDLTLKTTSVTITSASIDYNTHDWQIVEAAKIKNGLTNDHVTWEIINGEYRLTAVDAAGEDDEQLGPLSGELDLSGCTELLRIDVNYNKLTKLNVLNSTALEYLNCRYNALTELNVSTNAALIELSCGENQLTLLNVSNNIALTDLQCYTNQLTELDVSNNTALTRLICGENQLTELDVTNNTYLTELYCESNELTELDISNNPALINLFCFFNALTELDLSNNPALERLSCYANELTELDVSIHTALTELVCHSNWLTELDVSNNLMLTDLGCGDNLLTELDVSNNPELTDLWCNYNQLTELDVSNNPALTILYCNFNQLTQIDVTNNPALTNFNCSSNQLTELDISNNPDIFILDCSSNQLTELDVSDKTYLRSLYCYDNQLTELDVSDKTDLRSLYCYDNQLTQLDVSNNAALLDLYCYNNQLTQLDVSNNTALTVLDCDLNKLTQLDVSNNQALIELWCGGNQLTQLNVSNNPALELLACYTNQLTHLDVSNNTALTVLTCDANELTQLDVSNNPALMLLWCDSNQLTQLDVSNNTALMDLWCNFNELTFSTLPLPGTIFDYFYAPQNEIGIESSIMNDSPLDLSGEYLIDGTRTVYTWYYVDGTQVPKSLYSETDGVFVFHGLQNGEIIYCEMTNVKFSDLTLITTSITITEEASLDPPEILTTTPTTSSVELTWTPSEGATEYEIRYREKSETTEFQWREGPSTNDTTATVSSLFYDRTYEFQVRAKNSTGVSDWSAIVEKTTLVDPPPVPTVPDASPQSQTEVYLAWFSSLTAKEYDTQYRIKGTSTWNAGPSVSDTWAIIGNLEPGSVYELQVRARNAGGVSEWTDTVETKTYPVAPGNVAAIVNATNSVSLTWNGVTGANQYKIYRRDGDTGFFKEIGSVEGTNYTDTDPGFGTYYYYVTAVTVSSNIRDLESPPSETVEVFVPIAAPTNVQAVAVAPDSVVVSWDDVAGVQQYYVYRYIDSMASLVRLGPVSGTTFTNTGLSQGVKYNYYVASYDSATDTESDSSVTVFAITPLAVPTGFYVTETTPNSITLTWTNPINATEYEIRYRKSGTGQWNDWFAYDTTVTIFGLESNTNYEFQIRAKNNIAESAWSSTLTAQTDPRSANIFAIGADAGPLSKPIVQVYNADTGVFLFEISLAQQYGENYTGGVRVATGDLNGDGIPDIAVAPGRNMAPDIYVFNGIDGSLMNEFYIPAWATYGPSFKDGLSIAIGDVIGSGLNDIILVPSGGQAVVQVFENAFDSNPNIAFGNKAVQFNAFEDRKEFIGGASVAVGDVDTNINVGKQQIILGTGPGIAPIVRIFDVENGDWNQDPIQELKTTPGDVYGGINVAVGDINGDGVNELIVAQKNGGRSLVEIYLLYPASPPQLWSTFQAYDATEGNNVAVNLVAKDSDGDGVAELYTTQAAKGKAGFTIKKMRWNVGSLQPELVDTIFADWPNEDSSGLFIG